MKIIFRLALLVLILQFASRQSMTPREAMSCNKIFPISLMDYLNQNHVCNDNQNKDCTNKRTYCLMGAGNDPEKLPTINHNPDQIDPIWECLKNTGYDSLDNNVKCFEYKCLLKDFSANCPDFSKPETPTDPSGMNTCGNVGDQMPKKASDCIEDRNLTPGSKCCYIHAEKSDGTLSVCALFPPGINSTDIDKTAKTLSDNSSFTCGADNLSISSLIVFILAIFFIA